MNIQENRLKESLNSLLENFRDYNYRIWETEDKIDDITTMIDDEEYWDDEELNELIREREELGNKLDELKSKQKEEYEQELADLPPETDKRDFEGFRTDETDPRYWSDYIPRK